MASSLETWLADGTLQREAALSGSQKELAERLGMTGDQYIDRVRGIRKRGRWFPTFAELQQGHRDSDTGIATSIEFDEAKTDPNIRKPDVSRFPSLAAFDDPPLPAMPDGHRVRGVSTLVDADGQTKAQWIKTTANDDGRAAMIEAVKLLGAEMPKATPVDSPGADMDDLLCVLPLGDPHCGLLSWEKETGENFDLDIMERNLFAAVDQLVSLAPPAKHALVVSVGDYFHSDGQNNTTTKGTRVDVDGRTAKMIAVGIRTMRRVIDRALTKHEHVTVICARGNHDELLSLVLAIALSQFYEREPRVTIDTSPEMFHWFRFGQNLIGVHHGDKAKPMDMLGVMAVDRAKDWGETKHRRFYCGHIHHEVVKEVPGVTIEYLRTLAAGDAWHRGQGYRAGRSMNMDIFHREHGHVNRHIVGIEQLRRASGEQA